MTARWIETAFTLDVDHWDDITVDRTLLPDGDVRITFTSTPPVVITMSRQCAEVVEDRIHRARTQGGHHCFVCGVEITAPPYCDDCTAAAVA